MSSEDEILQKAITDQAPHNNTTILGKDDEELPL